MKLSFNVHDGKEIRLVSDTEISEYASLYGLDNLISGRYSSLFVINLMTLDYAQGIDPSHIIEEIRYLEGKKSSNQTKEPTIFNRQPLKGLWHKHFFPALPSVIGYNITNYFGKNGIRNLVEEIFDPRKSNIVTKDMIKELAHRVVIEPLENRGAQNKLTGEWIIYAKEDDGNYYLCVSPHNSGDENIASNINTACMIEFPFLSKYIS